MKRQKHIIWQAALVAALLSGSSSVFAYSDRENADNVETRVARNLSEEGISAITDEGFRMSELEVTGTNPYRFQGVFVKSEGSYAKTWWWTADRSAASFAQFAQERNARPLDIEITIVNGQRRYAGTFIHNVGEDAVQWKLFEDLSFGQLVQELGAYNGRVTDLDVRKSLGQNRYSGVMIKNQGSFAKNTLIFGGRNKQQLDTLISTTGMRLSDLERVGPNEYAGVLMPSIGLQWNGVDKGWDDVLFDERQLKGRVVDFETYTIGGQTRYAYVIANNGNIVETRVGQLLRSQSNGVRGFFYREIGVGEKGSILPDYRIYPASTIKMLQHIYWSNRVDNGLSRNTLIRIYNNHTADSHPVNAAFVNRRLVTTQQNMMFNSSNSDTNALQDAAGFGNGVVGRAQINTFKLNSLGIGEEMRLNHKFGAGNVQNDPANVATARSLSELYVRAADGTILSTDGFDYLRANMLNESSNSGFRQALWNMTRSFQLINGTSEAQFQAFWSNVRLCWKGGNIGTSYMSSAAWLELPYIDRNGRMRTRQFVLSAYVDDASQNDLPNISAAVLPEIVRDEVRATFATF